MTSCVHLRTEHYSLMGRRELLGLLLAGVGPKNRSGKEAQQGRQCLCESARVMFWKRQDSVRIRGCRVGVRGRFEC